MVYFCIGSKRSSHSNAYFVGLIKKRIVLFDTLMVDLHPDNKKSKETSEGGNKEAKENEEGEKVTENEDANMQVNLAFGTCFVC